MPEAALQQIGDTTVRHMEGDSPHTVITLPSQRHLAFGRNPHPEAGNEPGMHARAGIEALESFEKVAKASGGAVSVKDRTDALADVERIQSNLENYAGVVAREEEELYKPSLASPTEAIEDMEIRNYARRLTGEHRARFMETINSDLRIALAFARDPLKTSVLHQLAVVKWRERVEKEKPEAVERLGKMKDSVDWARVLMQTVRSLMATTPTKQ